MKSLGILTLILLLITLFEACKDDPPPEPQFITFAKADGADFTFAENQDRITDLVWITRGDLKGIFNIKVEASYQGDGVTGGSPSDTEWAFGTNENVSSLNFTTWAQAADGDPPGLVNRDMVLHLVTDDIYLDLKFLSWTKGDSNETGGFSYRRSVP